MYCMQPSKLAFKQSCWPANKFYCFHHHRFLSCHLATCWSCKHFRQTSAESLCQRNEIGKWKVKCCDSVSSLWFKKVKLTNKIWEMILVHLLLMIGCLMHSLDAYFFLTLSVFLFMSFSLSLVSFTVIHNTAFGMLDSDWFDEI